MFITLKLKQVINLQPVKAGNIIKADPMCHHVGSKFYFIIIQQVALLHQLAPLATLSEGLQFVNQIIQFPPVFHLKTDTH